MKGVGYCSSLFLDIMKRIYKKGLGFVNVIEEPKKVISHDIIEEEPSESVDSDIKRTSKRKSSK
jgi:hypothetical protein